MTRQLRRSLFLVAAAMLIPSGVAEACWCRRAYTRSYFNPCVTCPTVSRSYYIPVAACPTTSCSTTNVERCYYEPQTTYETRTVLHPQTAYVRRSYYDPITCCYRSYYLPTTQYVERSYQMPITTWSKRCSTEPATTCTTSYEPTSYQQTSSYWSPDGYRYYPVVTTVPAPHCVVPGSNGSAPRESSYGPANGSNRSNGTSRDPPNAPDPKPMPLQRQEGALWPGSHRAARPVASKSATILAPPAARQR